jgi:cytochrome b6-f complex iron-sulfur subunit
METRNCAGTANFPASADRVDEERRGFVKKLGLATLAVGIGGAIYECGKYMQPNVLYEPSKEFKAGALDKFPIGSRIVIEGRGVEIVRERDGIHAISLVCTHLGCLIKGVDNDPDVGYACPCHGSTFNMKGEVLGGPAPKALPWYEMYVDHTGALVVDSSKVNEKRTKLVV